MPGGVASAPPQPQAAPPQPQAAPPQPGGSGGAQSLTDAEQQWLDQEIEKAAQQQAAERKPPPPVPEPSLDDVPAETAAAAAAPPPEPEGGYDDVMAMIEANRKKNEEKRAVRRTRHPPHPHPLTHSHSCPLSIRRAYPLRPRVRAMTIPKATHLSLNLSVPMTIRCPPSTRLRPTHTITPLGTAAPAATLKRGCQSASHTSGPVRAGRHKTRATPRSQPTLRRDSSAAARAPPRGVGVPAGPCRLRRRSCVSYV